MLDEPHPGQLRPTGDIFQTTRSPPSSPVAIGNISATTYKSVSRSDEEQQQRQTVELTSPLWIDKDDVLSLIYKVWTRPWKTSGALVRGENKSGWI